MNTAQEIFDEIFSMPRDPRSPEYQAGVLAVLQFRLGETAGVFNPHKIGTAKCDAWFAGNDEGHVLARAELAARGVTAQRDTTCCAA